MMLKLKGLLVISCFMMMLLIGSNAVADCEADLDNSAGDATYIGPDEAISGTVCPEVDPFDYFAFEIPADKTVSGEITFFSEQIGTVMRVTGQDGDVYEQGTTDEDHKIGYVLPSEGLQSGMWFVRISFWSSYSYDHDYTLDMNLEIEDDDPALPEEIEDPPAFVIGDPTLHIIDVPLLEIPETVPWPTRRGGSRNRAWSTYNGPVGTAYQSHEYNLLTDNSITNSPMEDRFFGLTAGKNDMLYFAEQGANFAAYHATQGKKVFEVAGWLPICIGGDGLVYLTKYGEVEIECRNIDGTISWSQANTSGTLKLQTVGRRIYNLENRGIFNNYIYTWDMNKSIVWLNGQLGGGVIGFAEDPGAAVYLHTQYGLYQLGWNGHKLWNFEFTETTDFQTYKADDFGVIVGQDHRILVHHPWAKKLVILNPDMTVYHQYDYTATPENEPMAICSGAGSTLYIATKGGEVICYDNWSTELWRKQVTISGGIEDMILGSDGTIYVLYNTVSPVALLFNHYWESLNPANGGTMQKMQIELPSGFQNIQRGELAIGDNERLIYLNAGGYLVVFSKAMLMLDPDLKIRIPIERIIGGG